MYTHRLCLMFSCVLTISGYNWCAMWLALCLTVRAILFITCQQCHVIVIVICFFVTITTVHINFGNGTLHTCVFCSLCLFVFFLFCVCVLCLYILWCICASCCIRMDSLWCQCKQSYPKRWSVCQMGWTSRCVLPMTFPLSPSMLSTQGTLGFCCL